MNGGFQHDVQRRFPPAVLPKVRFRAGGPRRTERRLSGLVLPTAGDPEQSWAESALGTIHRNMVPKPWLSPKKRASQYPP
jgi:hypothetical protein